MELRESAARYLTETIAPQLLSGELSLQNAANSLHQLEHDLREGHRQEVDNGTEPHPR